MSARHQWEASTWPRGTLRSSRPRLMQLLPLPIPTRLKLSLLKRCLTVRVLAAAAAAAVVVPRL